MTWGRTGKPANRLTMRGFTLVEVMIAVTILAIGMVGIIRAYAIMVNTLEAADSTIESVCILKEKMFEVEKKAIEEKNLLPSSERGKLEGKYGDFEWQTSLRDVDSSLEDLLETEEEGEEPKKTEKDIIMYLKEAKVTVANEGVKPVRRFTLLGYVEGYEKVSQ